MGDIDTGVKVMKMMTQLMENQWKIVSIQK